MVKERPRVAAAFAAPISSGTFSGVWRVEGSWEEQAYGDAGTVVRERRVHAGIAYANWWTPDLRFEANAGLDSWNGSARTGSFGALLEQRLFRDHVAVVGSARAWHGSAAAARFNAADASIRYRSRLEDDGVVVRGIAGYSAVSLHAPRALWPGAGSGHARPTLLRAHPLLDHGVIRGPAFGRTLRFATVETQRWFARPVLPRLGIAAFVDLAGAARTHVDVGAGVRIKMPGMDGTLRADVARGIRDGAFAFSAAVSVD